jgi:uncharacterized lipoprotein YajG
MQIKSLLCLLLLLLCSLFVISCASVPLSLNYTPSNTFQGAGVIKVLPFTYEPADLGEVKKNQMQKNHPSVGEAYFDQDVGLIVADAIQKELRLSGYTLSDQGDRIISGKVIRFYYHMGSAIIKMYVETKIRIIVTANGKILYDDLLSAKKEGIPYGEHREEVRSCLAECITKFLNDAHKNGAL